MSYMTDRRKEREEKLKKLKDGSLKGKQKADFQFKMAKILERELCRFEELASLLDAIPDSYLQNIDFNKAAFSAMDLTEKLVNKANPAPIYGPDEKGMLKAFREFNIKNPFPGLDDTLIIRLAYEPFDDEVEFSKKLSGHIKALNDKLTKPNDYPQMHTMDEFNEIVSPWVREKSKSGNYKIVSTILAGSLAKEVAPGMYEILPTKSKKERTNLITDEEPPK